MQRELDDVAQFGRVRGRVSGVATGNNGAGLRNRRRGRGAFLASHAFQAVLPGQLRCSVLFSCARRARISNTDSVSPFHEFSHLSGSQSSICFRISI